MNYAIGNLKMFPQELRKTVTFDNGAENIAHIRLWDLEINTFFCHPYRSCEINIVGNSILQ